MTKRGFNACKDTFKRSHGGFSNHCVSVIKYDAEYFYSRVGYVVRFDGDVVWVNKERGISNKNDIAIQRKHIRCIADLDYVDYQQRFVIK